MGRQILQGQMATRVGRLSFASRSSFLSYCRSTTLFQKRSYAAAQTERDETTACLPAQNLIVAKSQADFNVASDFSSGDSATVGIFVNSGSAFENENNNGVSHVLKYLLAQSPVKSSGKTVAEELTAVGGRLSYEAGREQTVLLAHVPKNSLEKGVEVLGSIVSYLGSFSSQEQLERAKNQVLSVLNGNDANVDSVALEHLHSIAYQTSSLGLPTRGSIGAVSKLSPSDVASFVTSNFTRNRMVVAGVGSFENSLLSKYASNYFGGLPAGTRIEYAPQPFIGSGVTIFDDANDSCFVGVGFEGIPLASPSFYPMLLAQNLIGEYTQSSGKANNSSTRFAELVGNEHLASRFSTFNLSYATTGVFGCLAQSSKNNTENFLAESITEFLRLGSDARPAEVDRARRRVQRQLRNNYDSTAQKCSSLGLEVLSTGSAETLLSKVTALEDVSVQDVRNVCSNFGGSEPAVVGIGNTLKFPDYNQIRGWANWWRF